MEKITLHTEEVYSATHLLDDIIRTVPDYRAVVLFIKNIVKEVQQQMDCVLKTNSRKLRESFAKFTISLPMIDNEEMYCVIQKNANEWMGGLCFRTLFENGTGTEMMLLSDLSKTASICASLEQTNGIAIYERLVPYVKKFPEMAEKSGYDFTNVLIESINRNILDPVQTAIKGDLYSLTAAGRMKEYLEAEDGCIFNPFDYLKDIGFGEEVIDALCDSLDAEEPEKE